MALNELVQEFNDAVAAAGDNPQRKTPALYQAKKRILQAVKDGLAFRSLPPEIQQELRCHYHGVPWEMLDDGTIDCPSCRLEPSM